MTVKTVEYAEDELFHGIFRDNNPTTVNFMFPCHNKVDATQVLNELPYILYEELLVNPNDLITRPGIKPATTDIWDKDERNFTVPNELHN